MVIIGFHLLRNISSSKLFILKKKEGCHICGSIKQRVKFKVNFRAMYKIFYEIIKRYVSRIEIKLNSTTTESGNPFQKTH